MAKGKKGKKNRNRKDEYEVSEIIGHEVRKRGKKKQLWFLIKWKKDASQDWEPITSLDHCLESVTDYIEGKNESNRLGNNTIYNNELYSTRSPIKSVRIYQGEFNISINFKKTKEI